MVSAVAGLAGVGKTALAVQAGHAARQAGWFPGGVLFIDLHGYDDGAGAAGPGAGCAAARAGGARRAHPARSGGAGRAVPVGAGADQRAGAGDRR